MLTHEGDYYSHFYNARLQSSIYSRLFTCAKSFQQFCVFRFYFHRSLIWNKELLLLLSIVHTTSRTPCTKTHTRAQKKESERFESEYHFSFQVSFHLGFLLRGSSSSHNILNIISRGNKAKTATGNSSFQQLFHQSRV